MRVCEFCECDCSHFCSFRTYVQSGKEITLINIRSDMADFHSNLEEFCFLAVFGH